MDTCKAANLYSTWPADSPLCQCTGWRRQAVPGPVKPHIACPTTSARVKQPDIAIFDLLAMKAKTGIQSRLLKPTLDWSIRK